MAMCEQGVLREILTIWLEYHYSILLGPTISRDTHSQGRLNVHVLPLPFPPPLASFMQVWPFLSRSSHILGGRGEGGSLQLPACKCFGARKWMIRHKAVPRTCGGGQQSSASPHWSAQVAQCADSPTRCAIYPPGTRDRVVGAESRRQDIERHC